MAMILARRKKTKTQNSKTFPLLNYSQVQRLISLEIQRGIGYLHSSQTNYFFSHSSEVFFESSLSKWNWIHCCRHRSCTNSTLPLQLQGEQNSSSSKTHGSKQIRQTTASGFLSKVEVVFEVRPMLSVFCMLFVCIYPVFPTKYYSKESK